MTGAQTGGQMRLQSDKLHQNGKIGFITIYHWHVPCHCCQYQYPAFLGACPETRTRSDRCKAMIASLGQRLPEDD